MGEPSERNVEQRQALMRACADASLAEMTDALASFKDAATAKDVRAPEIGLVMLRGRVGGDGGAFNTGEATVTRAVVRLASGAVGYGYLLGRDTTRARAAATLDALGQDPHHRQHLEEAFVSPVRHRVAQERDKARAKTAATRVNFFTLARGQDGA